MKLYESIPTRQGHTDVRKADGTINIISMRTTTDNGYCARFIILNIHDIIPLEHKLESMLGLFRL